jgi:hypothetical protein
MPSNLPITDEVPVQTAETAEVTPQELVDRMTQAIRKDCTTAPEEYLNEVVARGSGE